MNKKQLCVLWVMGLVFVFAYFNIRSYRGNSVPDLEQVISMALPIVVIGGLFLLTFSSKRG